MTTAPTFDPKKAFFLIDSEHLDRIQTAFYGFTVQDGTVTCAPTGPLTGDGAYICVTRKGDTVTVTQDFMGSWGLYLFEAEDYFALSSSFPLLVDHIKTRFPITLNRDYAAYFLTADLCSASFSETMVQQIRLLDRAAAVTVSIPDRKLTLSYTDYQENTLAPDSAEGMAVLDEWFHKWAGLLRNLKKQTNNIQTDLSGGFDSRLVLSLLLGSKVDLKDVFFFSYDDGLHTHAEDFAIASAMAERFGFRLNHPELLTPGIPMATAEDILNISLYTKQSFHKQLYLQTRYYDLPRYNFVGNGGECVRDYWSMTEEEYIQNAIRRAKGYPRESAAALETAIRQVLSRSFRQVREKFAALGRPLAESEVSLNLYRETRCRNHFGKAIVERYLAGSITCAPLLDPLLHRLKRNTESCPDSNLLAALIYSRFGNDLLEFPFDSGRSIHPDTVAQARALNEAFPFHSRIAAAPIPTPREEIPEKLDAIPTEELHRLILSTLGSRSVQSQLEILFGRPVCDYIGSDIRSRKFHPLQMAYAAISAAWIAREAQLSRELTRKSLSETFFRGQLPEEAPEAAPLRHHRNLRDLITARIDLKQTGGGIELLDVTDRNAAVTSPDWFCSDGGGYVIESQQGSLTLRFRGTGTGKVAIALRGRSVTDGEGRRIPYFVDYTGVCLNGEALLTGPRAICHDTPMKLEVSAQEGQISELSVTWEPHDERRSRQLERIVPAAAKTEAPSKKKIKFWR